jgi:hypothetical protein
MDKKELNMSKKYTTSYLDIFDKYPITSKETGLEYRVKIMPYHQSIDKYSEGCIVTLYKKRFLFDKELINRYFNNNNSKINIEYLYSSDKETDYDYNMIEMTRLIVNLYEETIKKKLKNTKQVNTDFEDFNNWNGEV